jgi:hypothetical protein
VTSQPARSDVVSPRLRFRLLLGRSVAVGPGKADLLAAVAATGSIAAAGRSMGMSYKKAWYLLDTVTFQREKQDVVAVGAFGASISFPQGNQIRHRGSMTGARIIARADRAVCGRVRLVQL